MELTPILQKTLEIGGSDVFLIPGSPATAKVKGHMVALTEERVQSADTRKMIAEAYSMSLDHTEETLQREGDDDFSFSLQNLARFRCNAYKQRGTLAATFRLVAFGLPDPRKLNIPQLVTGLTDSCRSGMILVTGPAGSGKSTTLACMVDQINEERDVHIITIEDPIEYLHPHKRALVSQREIPGDACSFARALRAAMREAPDVIMLGEMRDYETIQTALTAAETGHLLLSSLHTVGADKESEQAKKLVAELEEDIMPIDGLIAFAGSDMGAKVFGAEGAKKLLVHAESIKAAGAKYCDCPACAACEKILAHKDELIG